MLLCLVETYHSFKNADTQLSFKLCTKYINKHMLHL